MSWNKRSSTIALLWLSRFNKIKSKFWSLFAGYKTNPVRWTQIISLREHPPGLTLSLLFWTFFAATKSFWHFNPSQSHSTAAFTEYNKHTEFNKKILGHSRNPEAWTYSEAKIVCCFIIWYGRTEVLRLYKQSQGLKQGYCMLSQWW